MQAIIAMHIAYNNSDYSILTWAPIYFMEVLGVPAARVGVYLTIPTILNMGGTFLCVYTPSKPFVSCTFQRVFSLTSLRLWSNRWQLRVYRGVRAAQEDPD